MSSPGPSPSENTISKEGGDLVSCESARTAVHREAKMLFQVLLTWVEGVVIWRVRLSLVHVAPFGMRRSRAGTILQTTIGARRMKGIVARELSTRIDCLSREFFQ